MTPTDRFVIRQQDDRRLFSMMLVITMVGVFGLTFACLKITRDGYDHEQLVAGEMIR